MNNLVLVPATTDAGPPQQPAQADSDARIVEMWFARLAPSSQRVYQHALACFFAFTGPRTLNNITASDLQAWCDHLDASELAPSTRNRMVAVVRSLLSFCVKLGWLRFNAGAVIRPAPVPDNLNRKILTETEIHTLISAARTQRDRVMLRFLYASGLRAAEVAGLTWADLLERDGHAQAVVTGKGGKTRTVVFSTDTWAELLGIRDGADDAAPVFPSQRTRGHLSTVGIWRLVKSAARRAGLSKSISPHWLRHGHASHSLDRGAKIHLLQSQLGHSSLATTSRYVHARPGDGSGLYLSV